MAKGRKRTAPSKGPATGSAPAKDLDPKKAKDKGVQSEMPKKYRLLLAVQQHKENKMKSRKEAGKGKDGKTGASKFAERKVGESLAAYNRRIDDSVRSSVNAAIQSTSKTRAKKKAWLSTRKSGTKSGGEGGKKGDEDSEDERERMKSVDHVKFGTQVMQPPSITAVPKKRGGNAAAIEALRKLEASKAEVASDAADSDPEPAPKQKSQPTTTSDDPTTTTTVGRKRKLKTLPEVERIAITDARARVIDHYRAMMAKKKLEGGGGREREAGSDGEGMDED
ncbi:uncharacterized protein EV422DRAFT_616846 [Fimicolochytrium jonesii]|uniref:uncharacterized protein n=1 Tax=Fimicolochytrium jonesii TaxID=1396493 RepID=UPI0022FEC73A|nr:uncharacterized protein EV422DRAFT_616846 [Fimicolochytrium jonesii]KAI8825799.1 hypothetical protein EV422DRAFT_616846 [Fimicolochytrium jonesii]